MVVTSEPPPAPPVDEPVWLAPEVTVVVLVAPTPEAVGRLERVTPWMGVSRAKRGEAKTG